eukprot:scaffold3713_cov372-Prasinococcus_capsulatus_cf.AAC.1
MPQQHLMQKPAIVREEGSRSGGNHATRKLAQHTDQLPTEQQAALWQSDVWAGKEISRPARPLRQPLLKAAPVQRLPKHRRPDTPDRLFCKNPAAGSGSVEERGLATLQTSASCRCLVNDQPRLGTSVASTTTCGARGPIGDAAVAECDRRRANAAASLAPGYRATRGSRRWILGRECSANVGLEACGARPAAATSCTTGPAARRRQAGTQAEREREGEGGAARRGAAAGERASERAARGRGYRRWLSAPAPPSPSTSHCGAPLLPGAR